MANGSARHDIRPAQPESGRAVGPHGLCRGGLRAWPSAQTRTYMSFFVSGRPVKHGPLTGRASPQLNNPHQQHRINSYRRRSPAAAGARACSYRCRVVKGMKRCEWCGYLMGWAVGSLLSLSIIFIFLFFLQTLCGLPRQLTPFDELSR